MNLVYLLLGANLGLREDNISRAISYVQEKIGTVNCTSHLYETEAWGKTDEPNFLNQVILVGTSLPAVDVMNTILLIENKMGRVRSFKNASRIIDIDILFYNDQIIHVPGLTIPHPEIPNRRFVLVPLTEIAPGMIHPSLNTSVQTLLDNCADPLQVKLLVTNV